MNAKQIAQGERELVFMVGGERKSCIYSYELAMVFCEIFSLGVDML